MNTQSSQPRRRAALRGAARIRDAATGGKAGRKLPFPLFLVLVTVAVTITSTAVRAFSSPAGQSWMDTAALGVLNFLDFFIGVVTLVSLTGSVVWGLVSTNMSVLKPHQRVFSQAVHRGLSTAALASLFLHVVVKISFGEAAPVDGVIPLGGVGTPVAVGLGTVAAHLMIGVAVTGILRSKFAHGRYPWIWRPIHVMGYASWLIGLTHGLTAGRPGKWYVLWGYGLCVAAVALAVLVRALGNTGKSAAELESTRKLMARDLAVSSAGGDRRPAAGRREGTASASGRNALLTRDIPIPASTASEREPASASGPEQTAVFPTTPEYFPTTGHQPAAARAEAPQPVQQPSQQQMPQQPVYQQPAPQQQPVPQPVGAVADTGEFSARFAAEWDTGELNALLDVGRQQYAAAQAAGVPYTGDPYTAAQYAGAQYAGAQPPAARYAQPQQQAVPTPAPQQPAAGYQEGLPYAPGYGYPAPQQPGYPADPFATGAIPQVQAPGVTLGAAAAPLQYFPPTPAAPADPFATGSLPQVPAAGYGYPAAPQPQPPAPAPPGAGQAYGSVPAAYSADPWQAR